MDAEERYNYTAAEGQDGAPVDVLAVAVRVERPDKVVVQRAVREEQEAYDIVHPLETNARHQVNQDDEEVAYECYQLKLDSVLSQGRLGMQVFKFPVLCSDGS